MLVNFTGAWQGVIIREKASNDLCILTLDETALYVITEALKLSIINLTSSSVAPKILEALEELERRTY